MSQKVNRKSVERMDRALSNNKFFKKKGLAKHPYVREMNFSAATVTNYPKKSTESFSIRKIRNRYNRTTQSNETGPMSDTKSPKGKDNSTEYSFYKRGFQEYEYDPFSTKIRPLTAKINKKPRKG